MQLCDVGPDKSRVFFFLGFIIFLGTFGPQLDMQTRPYTYLYAHRWTQAHPEIRYRSKPAIHAVPSPL